MKVFYFGAWGGPGHRIWMPSGATSRTAGPWAERDLDASSYRLPISQGRIFSTGRGFVPVDGDEREGVWRITPATTGAGSWTAIGCYDRSQDHRRGSVSIFVAEGEHDVDAMKAIAAQHFPAVWARIHERPS